jgi:hypothetical protein
MLLRLVSLANLALTHQPTHTPTPKRIPNSQPPYNVTQGLLSTLAVIIFDCKLLIRYESIRV